MKKLILIISYTLLLIQLSFAVNQKKIDSLNQIIKITKQDTVKIKTLLSIGDQYEYTNPDTALYFYQKALNLAKAKKEQKFIAKCLNYIGIIYRNQSTITAKSN